MSESTISQRIAEVMQKSKYHTRIEFSKAVDINNATLGNVLSGRSKPGFDLLHKLVEHFPNLNTRWLLSGVGEIFKDDSELSSMKKSLNNPLEDKVYLLENQLKDKERIIKSLEEQLDLYKKVVERRGVFGDDTNGGRKHA